MPTRDPELREFVVSRFSSIEQIDVFMLLCRAADRDWSPQEVATALEMAPESAGMRLFLLASAGLVAASGSPAVRYRYSPAAVLDGVAKRIGEAYDTDRSALVALVGGTTPARQFADAFRVRKP